MKVEQNIAADDELLEALYVLKEHNQWRKGIFDDMQMIEPKVITGAIETILEHFGIDPYSSIGND